MRVRWPWPVVRRCATTPPKGDINFFNLLADISGSSKSQPSPAKQDSILDGERLNVFPPVDVMKTEGTMNDKERELLERKREILEKEYELTDANNMQDWKDSTAATMPTTQDTWGERFGDLSDPLNRKLWDNDLRSGPDIRHSWKRMQEGRGNMTLEEGIQMLVDVVRNSSATNKVDLYRAVPQIACNTAWTVAIKERVLRDHMEGVEMTEEQTTRLANRDRRGKKFVALIKKKMIEKEERMRVKAEQELREVAAKVKRLQAMDDDLSQESADAIERGQMVDRFTDRTQKQRRQLDKLKEERRKKKQRMMKSKKK